MALSPQEKALVDRILNEEIQWRVQRWFALLAVLTMPVLGYFLTDVAGYNLASSLYVLTPVALIHVVSRWKGNATNQLILTLAKRVDETKDNG
jgi:hypothetical protein